MNVVKRMRNAGWLLLVCLAGAAPLANAEKVVLRIVFDGPILERQTEGAELMALFGQSAPKTLHSLVRAIETAADDANTVGIAMIIEQPGFSLAQLDEITRAIGKFKAKGKKVLCYLDSAGNGSYALAAAANHITLAEHSTLDVRGLFAEASYYKGMLDKLGLQMDMIHMGAYKSALEPFVRTEPSKEAAENINWLLDGIYDRWLRFISDGRGLSADDVRAAVDRAPLNSDEALKRKLVDSVGSFNDFRGLVEKEFGADATIVKKIEPGNKLDIDPANPFAFFEMISEAMQKSTAPAKPGIGLVYIEGPIMDGKSQQDPFGGSSSAGSTTIRAAFEEAREDPNIKAVVVRVNSPGGSALASDIMWEAATRCAAVKPLIVTMGSVAGSGGYYVAIPGQTIFAEEATITGSIGVVGGKMNWDGLFAGKLGITTTEYTRGKRAALMSGNRNWTEDERAAMTQYMEEVYTQFKGRITKSRGERIKGDLESLAGGRVYTGKQALERGLVDQLGGLSDAIRLAAAKSNLSDYEVYTFPRQKELGDILKEIFGEESRDEYELKRSPQAAVATRWLPTQPATIDPLLQAALPWIQAMPAEQARNAVDALRNLTILQNEKVGCFMPFTLTIE